MGLLPEAEPLDEAAVVLDTARLEVVQEAAALASVHETILKFEHGYDTEVGERGVTLSGGQKQRLSIARTLLIDPRILILDDSTSSVDTETEHYIRLSLNRLIKGRTTFIITHRLPIIRNADVILVMKDGEVLADAMDVEVGWLGRGRGFRKLPGHVNLSQ